jgi:hypothetical protein
VIAFKRVRTMNPSPPGGNDSLYVSVNGSTWTSTSAAAFSSMAPPAISFIHFGDASGAFRGQIYEAVLFDGAFSDLQMQSVYNYWKESYPNLTLP